MLTSPNLAAWDQRGAQLALSGRGDALPEAIERCVSPELIPSFTRILELTVEIGMADMYSADTDQPRKTLREVVGVLRSSRAKVPAVESVLGPPASAEPDGWGEPRSEEQHRRVRDWCQRTLHPST